jgi:hypothetical protein
VFAIVSQVSYQRIAIHAFLQGPATRLGFLALGLRFHGPLCCQLLFEDDMALTSDEARMQSASDKLEAEKFIYSNTTSGDPDVYMSCFRVVPPPLLSS